MTRHDDSQRSDRSAVMFGDLRVVDRLAASIASAHPGDPHESLTARRAYACDAGPDVRRAVGVCMMGRARGSHRPSGIWQGTLCPKKEVKTILKEPHARAA